ncbi:hypothetical protein ACFL1A_00055 [Patescibacteria group bacterium]
MNLAFLDAVLIASLSIPLIMAYRILPVVGTSYLGFGLIFGLLLFNILISSNIIVIPTKYFSRLKNILTILILTLVFGGVMFTAIVDRGRIAPGSNYNVHDIVLQTESALRFLSEGKNPYKETYFGTPMEDWNYGEGLVNPALYHFVMPPFYLLSAYPFFYTSMRTIGFFDGRMPLFFMVLTSIFALLYLFKNKSLFRIATIFFILNPATVHYLVEGRSDLYSLSFLIIALFLLNKRRFTLSSVVFSFAVLSKQTVWFMVPLWSAYLYQALGKSFKQTLRQALVMLVVALIISGPFVFWNPYAFFDSIIFYLSGNTTHGYPVSGYGLGMLLNQLGIIKDVQAYYPFIYWQIILGSLMFFWGIKKIFKKPNIGNLMLVHAISLSVIWYVSRYFNNSHAGYLSTLFLLSYFLISDENKLTDSSTSFRKKVTKNE